MRNFKILAVLSILILMQVVFTGCEKYNEPASVDNIQTKSSGEKGFEVTDPVLVDKQHYDSYGNVGNLYLDKYDETRGVFEAASNSNGPSKDKITGTKVEIRTNGVVKVTCDNKKVCNCYNSTTMYKGVEVNCIITYLDIVC